MTFFNNCQGYPAASIELPMLFLSGTRDALADPALLESAVSRLRKAELHWLDTADHGYRVLKGSRRTDEDVFDEIARLARAFIDRQAGPSAAVHVSFSPG